MLRIEMASYEREELVRRVGEAAEGAGYSGAQLRLPDGTTLALWSTGRGVRLVPSGRSGT